MWPIYGFILRMKYSPVQIRYCANMNVSKASAPRHTASLLLDNCSCVVLLPSIHGHMHCPNTVRPVHMLTPLTYVHVGNAAIMNKMLRAKLSIYLWNIGEKLDAGSARRDER